MLCLKRGDFLFVCFPFVVLSLSNVAQEVGAAHAALKASVIEEVCGVSNELKKVPASGEAILTRTEGRIAGLENTILKFRVAEDLGKLVFSETKCQKDSADLDRQRELLKSVHQKWRELQRAVSNASAYAALSAGRLDEFILVFTQAAGSARGCVSQASQDGTPATQAHLTKCFSSTHGEDTGVAAIKESSLADIRRLKATPPEDLELESKIDAIKQATLSSVTESSASSAQCHLLKGGSGGMLNGVALNKDFLWAGGLLSIGTSYSGGAEINAGADAVYGGSSLSSNAKWTKTPTTAINHFKNALAAYDELREIASNIDRQIERAEGPLKACIPTEILENKTFSSETFDEHHQIMVNKTKALTAELGEAKRQLERYKKEKGELKPLTEKGETQGDQPISSVHAVAVQTAISYLPIFLSILP